jgi:hypothetical protein
METTAVHESERIVLVLQENSALSYAFPKTGSPAPIRGLAMLALLSASTLARASGDSIRQSWR